MLLQSIKAAVLAGNEILDVYNTAFDVEYKEDKSPLTLADKRASDVIIQTELENIEFAKKIRFDLSDTLDMIIAENK